MEGFGDPDDWFNGDETGDLDDWEEESAVLSNILWRLSDLKTTDRGEVAEEGNDCGLGDLVSPTSLVLTSAARPRPLPGERGVMDPSGLLVAPPMFSWA